MVENPDSGYCEFWFYDRKGNPSNRKKLVTDLDIEFFCRVFRALKGQPGVTYAEPRIEAVNRKVPDGEIYLPYLLGNEPQMASFGDLLRIIKTRQSDHIMVMKRDSWDRQVEVGVSDIDRRVWKLLGYDIPPGL